MLTLVIVSEE